MKATGLSRVSKDLIVSEIEKELKSRPSFFIAQHGSIAAASLDKLRARLRSANSRYMVVKNSLGRRALEKSKLKELSGSIEGGSGIAFSSGDPAVSSKILVEFAKANEQFKIRQGYMNGAVLSVEQVNKLASLPSREVLLSRSFGAMMAPVQNFVSVLSGTVRKIVTVLDAIAKSKKQ